MKTAAIILALASTALLADGRPTYVSRLPNGGNVGGVAALGHVETSGGGPRNTFGSDFAAAGRTWTVAFCQADSDGDGQTNGQELGDPCCKWTSGSTPSYSSGVSHPGDASSKANPSLWAAVSCGSPTTAPTTQPSTAPSTGTPEPGSPTTTPSTTKPGADSSSGSTTDVPPSGSTTEEPTDSETPGSAASASTSSSGSTGSANVPSPSTPVPSPSGASTVVVAASACAVALVASLL